MARVDPVSIDDEETAGAGIEAPDHLVGTVRMS
jgi:hypothetical protein